MSPFSARCQESAAKGKKLKLCFKTVEEMAEYLAQGHVALVDAVFCDPLGLWHHCTFAPSECEAKDLKLGFAFDGSSIRLFITVDQSDMLMVPDPTTCWIDPFCKHSTLHVVCSIFTASGEPFDRCPRQIAKRASRALVDLGLGEYCMFGPEPEFFVFDHVRVKISDGEIAAEVTGEEAPWLNGERRDSTALLPLGVPGLGPRNNLGGRLFKKQMYFPVRPIDSMMDLRSDMLLTMSDVGVPIEKHHHEVGICQNELGFRCCDLVEAADHAMTYKYIVKNVARMHGKTATFMPKPIYGEAGSGFHIHQSVWSKDGKNLFYDYHGEWFHLSKMAMYYIGGILKHAWAVLAITNPTTNSYKRLVPGYEAPCNLVYSKGNRTAAIRIPLADPTNAKTKRLECRFPDGSGCPYLSFAALLLAGIDGVINKIEPPPPCTKNAYQLSPEEAARIPSTPPSLDLALDALERDHAFLLRQNAFQEDFIKAYIAYKREEIRSVALIPHPKEFELYYAV